MITVSKSDYLWYVDQALDAMAAIVDQLGDGAASRRPAIPGANSPYAILTHCLGVMEYWAGHLVAGRTIERDRDAEFHAAGPVAPLLERAARARRQIEADLATMEPSAPLRNEPDPEDVGLPIGSTQAGALVHVLRELAQHLGHMEVARDLLLGDSETSA